jgi:HTH-type transcriptional regulator / antitoxin HigA
MPVPRGIELIKALMVEDNLQPCNLLSIFGDESVIVEVLDGKRELTSRQVQKLGDFFQISPLMFLTSE